MDCLSEELLQDLVDGELRDSAATQAIEHIRSCDRCRREFAEILALYEGLRSVVAKDACPSKTALEAYARDALSPTTMATVKKHTAFCSECRSYVWLLTASESELAKWRAEEEHAHRRYEATSLGREAAREALAILLPVGLEFVDRLWDSACQLVLDLRTKASDEWPKFGAPGQLAAALGFAGDPDPERTATSIILVATLLVAQRIADGEIERKPDSIAAAIRDAAKTLGAGRELQKRLVENLPKLLLASFQTKPI